MQGDDEDDGPSRGRRRRCVKRKEVREQMRSNPCRSAKPAAQVAAELQCARSCQAQAPAHVRIVASC